MKVCVERKRMDGRVDDASDFLLCRSLVIFCFNFLQDWRSLMTINFPNLNHNNGRLTYIPDFSHFLPVCSHLVISPVTLLIS